MKKFKIAWLFFLVLMLVTLTVSQAYALFLKVAVGLCLPPYIIEDQNKGMELDIVREALAMKGHRIQIKYMPYGLVANAFNNRRVDIALTVNADMGIDKDKLSEVHITYRNVAISLKKREDIRIDSIGGLSNWKIVAFQQAKELLGPEYAKAVEKAPQYSEIYNQEKQISGLFEEKTDVIVMDINIYTYYINQLKDKYDIRQAVVHDIFPDIPYRVAISDPKILKDFNEALNQLKNSGQYSRIIKGYLEQGAAMQNTD